jgi:hypothetical protein
MTYDTVQFYNSAAAIITGVCSAALAILLVPPLSPTVRARRVLAFTLRELRRLAAGRINPLTADWEGRAYYRVSVTAGQPRDASYTRKRTAVTMEHNFSANILAPPKA